MIEGKKISKTFGNLTLFKEFSFAIKSGEFVCFSGASGTGKTTLLNMIGHIESVDSGEILINGKQYCSNKERLKFFRSQVGFLFQNFVLIEAKSVEENLQLIRKDSRTEYSIQEVLQKVGLDGKQKNKVYTLSGGEQQRVALARLFYKKCEIILADEPTGSLDRKNADIVMKILLDLNQKGKTVVLVTHDERIKGMADRVIAL